MCAGAVAGRVQGRGILQQCTTLLDAVRRENPEWANLMELLEVCLRQLRIKRSCYRVEHVSYVLLSSAPPHSWYAGASSPLDACLPCRYCAFNSREGRIGANNSRNYKQMKA